MKLLVRYFSLWAKLTLNSFLSTLSSRLSAIFFLIGKILRFIFFLGFLFALFSQTQTLSSYNGTQTLFFFLTFTIIDTATQLFFREVYRFRPMVVSGDFDLVLVKPISPLFRALAGGADPLDLIMLVPYIGLLIFVGTQLQSVSLGNVFLYVLLLINAFLISTGFHVLVLSLAILTTEIDHTIMIYRDLTSMGRLPIDIYHEPLRSLITFVVPVGVMMTFPAKALMGLLRPDIALLSWGIGICFFFVCLKIWKYALSKYSSASS